MEAIDVGALVIVHCREPREKMWGVLLRLDSIGLTVRGLDLASVEDWLRQERAGEAGLSGPSTFFIPTHRIVRVDLTRAAPRWTAPPTASPGPADGTRARR